MTNKEFLQKPMRIQKRIDALILQKQSFEELANSIPGGNYSQPVVQKTRSQQAPFIKWIDKIMEVEKKIERYKTLLADWVKLANSQIELVDNVDYSIVLKCRFIEQMAYEDIGDKIYVSLATVKRWLRYAINDFGRINNYKIES